MLHISNGRYGLTSTCGDSRPDSNPIEKIVREIGHLAPMSADEISAAEDEPVLIEWRAVRDGTMTAYSARKDRARDRPPRSDVRR